MTTTGLPARKLTNGVDGEMFQLVRAVWTEPLTIKQQVSLGNLLRTINEFDSDDTLDDATRWRYVARSWRQLVADWLDEANAECPEP